MRAQYKLAVAASVECVHKWFGRVCVHVVRKSEWLFIGKCAHCNDIIKQDYYLVDKVDKFVVVHFARLHGQCPTRGLFSSNLVEIIAKFTIYFRTNCLRYQCKNREVNAIVTANANDISSIEPGNKCDSHRHRLDQTACDKQWQFDKINREQSQIAALKTANCWKTNGPKCPARSVGKWISVENNGMCANKLTIVLIRLSDGCRLYECAICVGLSTALCAVRLLLFCATLDGYVCVRLCWPSDCVAIRVSLQLRRKRVFDSSFEQLVIQRSFSCIHDSVNVQTAKSSVSNLLLLLLSIVSQLLANVKCSLLAQSVSRLIKFAW